MATDLLKSGKTKNNTRKKGIAAQWKQEKREEAKVRDAARAKLTPQQQLAKLDAGGFRAEKERARLMKQIAAGGKTSQ